MLLLIGALTIGLILSLLALGVFISFRIFEFPDITATARSRWAASVAAVLLVAHVAPAAWPPRRRSAPARWPGAIDRPHQHALRHQPPALGHPRDDGALLGQPARDGQEQRAAALRAHARVDRRRLGTGLLGATVVNLAGWDVNIRDLSMLVFACWSSLDRRRAALPVLPHEPRHGDAGGRRQRADDPGARRERGQHGGARASRCPTASVAVSGRAADPVPGIRRRPDGHRHGGLGPGEHHHRRGAGRRPQTRASSSSAR